MNEEEKQQLKSLLKIIDKEANQLVENVVREKKKNSVEGEFQRLNEAKKKIWNKLNHIYKWLMDDFERIENIQYLFEFKAKNSEERKERVIRIVMNSLQSLANMDLIIAHRGDVLKNFINANRPLWRIQIN